MKESAVVRICKLIPIQRKTTQVNFKKRTMGETSGRKAEIYIFARSIPILIPSIAIEFRALGKYVISDIYSRLLGHISTTRYSSKFRALRNYILSGTLSRLLEHISRTRYSSKFRAVGENEPIGKILPTPRTQFDHTESIEVLTARETETYWNHISEYSD